MTDTSMPQQTCAATDTDGNTVLLRCDTSEDGRKIFFRGDEELSNYEDDGVMVAINRNGRKYIIQS